jgi:hypothetical protein
MPLRLFQSQKLSSNTIALAVALLASFSIAEIGKENAAGYHLAVSGVASELTGDERSRSTLHHVIDDLSTDRVVRCKATQPL